MISEIEWQDVVTTQGLKKNINMDKKYVLNEKEWKSSLDPDLDPYGEESDDDFTEFDLDEDFSIKNSWVETIYTFNVTLGNYNLKYELRYDDDGFSTLERVEQPDEKIPDHVLDFLEENEDEIKDILYEHK